MSLYAIGDLHLSLSSKKPMDIFGACWENHVTRLQEGFSALSEEDTCVICGDLSWGMSLDEAKADFKFLDSLPGKKLVLKGNHDYWWSTAAKTYNFFSENGISTIKLLYNNSYIYGDTALCGTRGWFYEEETHGAQDKKIMARELIRLEASLISAGSADKICFFHYPPVFNDYVCEEIIEILDRYDVKTCCYGHIHGAGQRYAVKGKRFGIDFHLVSADYLGFRPYIILN